PSQVGLGGRRSCMHGRMGADGRPPRLGCGVPANAAVRGRKATRPGSQALGGRSAITGPCRRPTTDPCRRGPTSRLTPTRTGTALPFPSTVCLPAGTWCPSAYSPAARRHLVPERLLAGCPQGTWCPGYLPAGVPAQMPPHDFAGTYCWFFAGEKPTVISRKIVPWPPNCAAPTELRCTR